MISGYQSLIRIAQGWQKAALQQEKTQTSRPRLAFSVWVTPPRRASFIGFRVLISRICKMTGPYLFCSTGKVIY
jgi:hypothetical protein